jgi:hypothetical protein
VCLKNLCKNNLGNDCSKDDWDGVFILYDCYGCYYRNAQ